MGRLNPLVFQHCAEGARASERGVMSTSKRWWVSGLVGVGLSAIAGSAAADPMTHDGFYFRGAAGLGYFKSTMSVSGITGYPETSMSGVDIGFDAWFGGSPIPGLAI